MNESADQLVSRDGTRLRLRSWRPDGDAVGTVQLLHGLGDHSGMHPQLVEGLLAANFAVYAVDLRGHGESAGRRGHVEHWARFREDVAAVEQHLGTGGATKRALVGISMGALLALDVTLATPGHVSCVAASSTPLGETGVPGWMMGLGRVASRIWPTFSLRTGMPLDRLAHDQELVSEVLADPLFHRVGTARLSTEITSAMERVRSQLHAITRPCLLLHGGDDSLVPPGPARSAATESGNPLVVWREYPTAWHALFEDGAASPALGELVVWLQDNAA